MKKLVREKVQLVSSVYRKTPIFVPLLTTRGVVRARGHGQRIKRTYIIRERRVRYLTGGALCGNTKVVTKDLLARRD